ncbi:MAG TPA: hypothetical protein P5069_16520, partial [Candidatus Hydrogenedentes bacterium]|nr:hypothetical protein [Candidatus Hydrogenedentota bacterium]
MKNIAIMMRLFRQPVCVSAAWILLLSALPGPAQAEESPACQAVTGDSLVLAGTEPGALCYGNLEEGSVTVRSTHGPGQADTVVYEAGRDYVVDAAAGTVARTENSRIPDFRTNMLYGQKDFDHTAFPGFGNRAFFVYVDYRARGARPLCAPRDQ